MRIRLWGRASTNRTPQSSLHQLLTTEAGRRNHQYRRCRQPECILCCTHLPIMRVRQRQPGKNRPGPDVQSGQYFTPSDCHRNCIRKGESQ